MQRQCLPVLAEIKQFARQQGLAGHLGTAGQHQHAVFEIRPKRNLCRCDTVATQIHAQQRAVNPGRRFLAKRLTDQQRHVDAVLLMLRQFWIMVERGIDMALVVRQGNPQLRGLQQRRALRGRFLGVADATSGGHQVDLTGADQLFITKTVAMKELTGPTRMPSP